VGVLLHPLLSFLLMLYFLVMEYTGFVLDRKGFPFRRQREYIRSQRARMMGYGLGVFCLLSVPFLQLLAMPLAVIGATMLYVEHPMAEDPAYAGREEGRA